MLPTFALTATEIVARLRAGAITAREVAEAALARIDAANPQINAVVDRFDAEALAEADAVDARLARGEDPGPLAGVPVTVKVNVDQAGRATTNGLTSLANAVAAEDNPVVANLRRAGAVIVGRTNTPAFSLRWFTRNGLHGATVNPRDPARTPGGSSGGAGAAVAAGMGAIGHGTDIAGSVRYPAYACGVHGLRPTLGRIPAVNLSAPDRHIGAQLMAVSGPLARSIPDLRRALAAMAAPDPRDPWWCPAPLEGPQVPRRAALCVSPDGLAVVPEVEAALRRAADRLADAGWQVEVRATPPLREPARLQILLWMTDMRRSGFAAAIAAEADPDASFVFARLAGMAPEADVSTMLDALQARAGLVRAWRRFLDDWPVLLCPVSGELPFVDHRDTASEADFAAVFEAQLTQVGLPFVGVPALAVATGSAGSVPLGVQLVAAPFREDLLFTAGEIIAPDPVPVAGSGW